VSAATTPATGRASFLGVDVGGTFTDVVLADADGKVLSRKVTTTPHDPREGVTNGIREVLEATGTSPADIARVVHGTTLATNVILERRGSSIAFVTTEGFRDLLRLGREVRAEDERFDLWFRTPESPVPSERTFEVRERVDGVGQVLTPLAPGAAEEVARQVAATNPAAVAICFLHAYANPAHEDEVAAAVRALLPEGTYVATSAEVWPEVREYERAITTVMCAYVGPVMASYLAGLGDRLTELGITCPLEIMESSGGVMSAELAAQRPVYTVESGGAAGVIAAGYVGRQLGADEVISFDMGGTTAKTGIVRDGRPDVTHDFQVGGQGSFGGHRSGDAFPIKVPVVDIAEVGAGGGSIAWVDNGGALRVGPRSAGSVPGPACYGRGGTEPTVTDANLLLGYLKPGDLNGGVSLDPGLSEAAVRRVVTEPLGLDVADAAWAIHEIANASMAAAIRVVTVQRGIDPRGFTLVGFGGAGPMHAARLADTFDIDTVVVPWAAGVASAVGLVSSDLTVDRVQTHLINQAELSPERVNGVFDELERIGRSELPAGTAGGGAEAVEVTRSVDARYQGQAHQLNVPAPGGTLGEADLHALVKAFEAEYLRTYGIELDAPVQLVNFRIRLVRPVQKLTPVPAERSDADAADARTGSRPAWFAGTDGGVGGFTETDVYDWSLLGAGATIPGPAIIEGPDTTVVVPPTFSAEADRWRNVLLHRSR
jgi:N-methylhydantoinase A